MNAMSGVTEEEQKTNIEKIVKNVTKSGISTLFFAYSMWLL